jgi:hypothetical protein
MKITAKNLVEKWDEIKDKMPDYVTVPSAAYLEFADIYDDLDEDTISKFDAWLADVNEALAKSPKSSRKYVRGNGKLRRKKPQTKPEPKKETKKRTSAKTKLAEAPNWLKTLRSFKNAAGKERTVTGIRKMVMDIQDRFDAKRGRNTPHIDIIRDIQDKLLPYANKKTAKVQLPQWEDLVERCKKAIATVAVSSKVEKEDIKTTTLSGTRRKRKTGRRPRK